MRVTASIVLAAVALALIGCSAPPPPSPSSPRPVPTDAASPTSRPAPVDSPSPAPSQLPSATAATGPELAGLLECEGSDLKLDAGGLGAPANAELAPDGPAAALRAFLASPEAESLELPKSGWRRVLALARSVTFLAHGSGGWVTATVELADDGTWQFFEGGSCPLRVRLPDGLGFATWRLDPASLPVPGDRSIVALVTEIACASGRPTLGRLLPPVILASEEAVTIAFAVRSLPAGQDCPANPETRVLVELREPLGGRPLFDGSTFPAAPRS